MMAATEKVTCKCIEWLISPSERQWRSTFTKLPVAEVPHGILSVQTGVLLFSDAV
jgi:hypothetical protein